MDYKKLKDYIYSFQTWNKMGFTNCELMIVLSQLGLKDKMEEFFSAMGVRTCAVIEGKTITYHEDVILGLTCVFEDREPTAAEWD